MHGPQNVKFVTYFINHVGSRNMSPIATCIAASLLHNFTIAPHSVKWCQL